MTPARSDPHRGAGLRHRLPAGARQAPGGRRLAVPRAREPRAARRDRRHAAQRASSSTSRCSGRRAGTTSRSSAPRLPGLGVIVCTGRSSVAQRVRGLRLGADDWMTKPCHPGGADRAGRGGRAAAQARRGARRRRPARDRRGRDPAGPVPGLRRRRERRPDAARVRAHPAARRRAGAGHAARGDLPARLGLRDGPRRPLGRRVRAQAAPEARAGVAAAGATSTRTSGSATGSRRSRVDAVADASAAGGASRRRRRAAGRRRAAPVARRRSSPASTPERAAGYRSGRGPGPQHAPAQLRDPDPDRGGRLAAAGRRDGDERRSTTSSGIVFAGGLVFFGYRMYMEHRADAVHARGPGRARCSTARSC